MAVSASTVLSIEDVRAARRVIDGRLHHTPIFSSATLSEHLGTHAFLKAELFQRTGSFKPRGVLNKLASLTTPEKKRGVIGISAGNHAQALAYGSAVEGVSCLVVMWTGASTYKIAAARGYGAEIDLEADSAGGAFERLAELRSQSGRTLVHPFDDPLVMAGQGTVGLEILEDVPEVDLVVCPVGGAGLVSGLATAVKGVRPGARVLAVEPEGSDALRRALEAGEPVAIEPRSVADGLNAPFAGTSCLAVCRELVDDVVLVTESEIAAAMRFLYERAKLACEPAGAAATAALLAGKVALEPGSTVASVVSGGNISPGMASAILGSDEG